MYVQLVKKGAQILLVPSAFTVPTGSAHWHTLLQGTLLTILSYFDCTVSDEPLFSSDS
jgi:nitrilase